MVVWLDGVRTPFLRSGSEYAELIAYDLAREVIKAALVRHNLSGSEIDGVVLGTVVQNPETPNVARDAALGAGLPKAVVAHTVTMACISANQAIAQALNLLKLGQAQLMLAGGVEMLSDIPIGFSKEVRKRFFESRKYKNALEWRKFIQGLSASELLPKAPAIAEFTTGEVMGESADKLAASFGISREQQDAYALRSHQLASQASEAGYLADEIAPMCLPPSFKPINRDNTIRADSTLEKLAALKPAFIKPFGTVTAGNSSPLTDGAAVTLLATRAHAEALGLSPKAALRDYLFVAQDPGDELLLGPAYAVPKLLARNGLRLSDIDVIEIHEAFAGQVLAVFAALESDRFAQQKLGLSERVGSVELDKVNRWGGSLSLGHPFGATGARLVNQAVRRLAHEDGQLALVTACAAGGLGHAMLIERLA